MSRLDDLPADQRNTLQLLLKHGKSYEELADMLRIEPDAVRTRALDALDALGPDATGLTQARQDEVSDYLLGQQSAEEQAQTRSFLEGSAAGRAWGRVVSTELRTIARESLPEIPAEAAEQEEAFEALTARTAARERQDRSSKLGGWILLAGIGVIVAIVIVLLVGRGDDNNSGSKASTKTSTSSSNSQVVEAQANLTHPGSNTIAVGIVSRQGSNRSLTISGENFPPTKGFHYGVWLYNSPSKAFSLGLVPQEVTATGANAGKIGVGADPDAIAKSSVQGAAQVAQALRQTLANIFQFKELVITKETGSAPGSRPGPIVVRGTFQRPKG